MSKNLEHFEKLKKRKSKRYAAVGRAFEEEVSRILEAMKEEGLIDGYVAHPPYSAEDHDGRDFTAKKVVVGVEQERSFGVTISNQSYQRAKILHPQTPQFWFPIGTKPETIRKRILGLFEG